MNKKTTKKSKETAQENNMFYAIVEAQNIHNDSPDPCDDLLPYAALYKSHEAARDALREQMRDVVNACYEGLDDDECPNIDDILDEILDNDSTPDRWSWSASDRDVVWRIVELDV